MSDFSKAEQPRRTRRQFLINSSLLGVAAGLGSAGLTACGGGTGSNPNQGGEKGSGRPGRAGETLFIAGFQWAAITNFNPFSGTPGWPSSSNVMQLLYESLLRYNLLSGELEPGIATELQTPDANTFVLPIQPDAKWQDGQPVTAKDVVYSLEMPKRHSELDQTLWSYIDSAVATDDKTVTIKLKQDSYNPGLVKQSLATTWILPEHIWSKLEADKSKKIAEHTNLNPVGSGPYKIENYTQQQLNLIRHEDYWGKTVMGGLPAPKYITHPVFKDNTAGNLAFEQGKIDVMQQFTPEIWKMWEDKKRPIATWFDKEPYYLGASLPMMVINCQQKGLTDPKVRRAIAFAINYPDIADKAMSRYSVPATPSMIVPAGAEEKFYDATSAEKDGWKYDVTESERIMKEVGATKGSDGIWKLADGTRMGPWKFQTPNGWSDWQAAVNIVSANLKKAGFDVSPNFPDQAAVTDSVNSGNFDFTLWYVSGASPAAPWLRIRDVLDDRGVPKRGERAFYNYGRFKDPAVPGLLDQLAKATDEAEQKDLILQLDTIFRKNAPMIPMMIRPDEFYEFSETNWTGFPTAKNPTAPPQFRGAGVNWLYKIKKA